MYFVQALDFPGASGTAARNLNNIGQVLGEAYSADFHLTRCAVLWDSMLPIDIWPKTNPPSYGAGASPIAEGINDSGDIVISGNFDGFLYRDGALMPTPAMKQQFLSVFPKDINNHGLITGMAAGPSMHADHWPAFIYDSKADTPPVLIHNPAGGWFEGLAINNHGQVVCRTHSDPNDRVYLYSNGELTDLFSALTVNDLNDAGQIVGTRKFNGSGQRTAFLCDTSSGTPQLHDLGALTSLGHQASDAWGINAKGDVVGESRQHEGYLSPPRAFLRRANGQMQDLNSLLIPKNSGWTLSVAFAINDRGQIAGHGSYNGQTRGFLLTPLRVSPVPDVDLTYHHDNMLSRIYALVAGSAGVWFGPGTRPVPIDPEGRLWEQLPSDKRDIILGVVMTEIAGGMHDRRSGEDLERAALQAMRRALDRMTRQ